MQVDIVDVLKKVLTGETTAFDAAQQLNTTEEKVWEYVRTVDIKKDPEVLDEVPNDSVGMLRFMVKHLNKRVIQIVKMKVDPVSSRMVQNEVNVIEKLIMDIAKLTHELENTPAIQINNIKVEAIQLQQMLIGELCPSCQEKMLGVLNKLEEIRTDGKTMGLPQLSGPDQAEVRS